MNKNILDALKNFIIWFSLFYLMFWGYSLWQDKKEADKPTLEGIILEWVDETPVSGQLVRLKVTNFTDQAVGWSSVCQNTESLSVNRKISGKNLALEIPECSSTAELVLPAGESAVLAFPEINHILWQEAGDYEATLNFVSGGENQSVTTDILEVKEAGFIRKTFRTLITQPLFNLLVFFLEYLPGHVLGWAIICMTIVVRIILFPWNQTAMKSQRKLQKMQPEMEAIRKKHGKNQQVLALKTMELYKKHKINPMSSCWPMLMQMPFLIGIYLVVKDGLSPHQNHLLYSFFSNFDLSLVDHYFFGLNLEVPNVLVLPVLVGAAQFLAIKLSMIAAKKNNDNKSKGKDKKANTGGVEGMQAQMEQMQKMMLWMLPVMIAVFTATFPAAVGVYWLTSTIFGIGQQKLVNWQLDQPKVKRKN